MKTSKTAEKIYQAALIKWGPELQMTMVFEEMAELQKELCKQLRGMGKIENIAEEIADVEIMLGQMKELFNIEKEVEFNKSIKLRRLATLTGFKINNIDLAYSDVKL